MVLPVESLTIAPNVSLKDLSMTIRFVVPAALLAVASSAGAASLSLGDPAPALPPVTWHLGEPVTEWKAGEVYVLDFWATWCRPCIASMPHMVDVQTKYKDKKVKVVGLAIWPNDSSKPTKAWVEGRATDAIPQNDNLNYAIADDIGNKVSDAFMRPMDRNGIPTVMIIDQKGRLAWVGHPMSGMDEVLGKIVEGTYDLEKEAAAAKKKAETMEKAQGLIMEFQTAQMKGDWSALLEAADKMLALDAEQFPQAALYKYFVLAAKLKDTARAAAVGKEAVAGVLAKDPALLNGLAFMIVDHEEIADDQRDLDLALEAVTKANDLEEGKRAEVLDTLARVHFVRKNYAEAVANQEKAVALATDDEEMRKEFEESLEEYKKASAATATP
jgi:thiol-disulfide isomerase/thioredoxin